MNEIENEIDFEELTRDVEALLECTSTTTGSASSGGENGSLMVKKRKVSLQEFGHRQDSNTLIYPPSEVAASSPESHQASMLESSSSTLQTAVFIASVGGMSCSACVNAIESHLNDQPGIFKASVSLALERVDVEYNPSVIKVPFGGLLLFPANNCPHSLFICRMQMQIFVK